MKNILSNIKLSLLEISNKIRYHNSVNLGHTFVNSKNKSGESPKELDLICNDFIINNLKGLDSVRYIASEEEDELFSCNTLGDYLITLDPLDGSSCISSNLPIGTIFSIWKYKQKDFKDENMNDENIHKWTNSSRLPSLLGAKSLSGSFEKNYLENGHDIITAGYCLYGYSTQLVIADNKSVSLELLNKEGSFDIINSNLKIPELGDTYSYNGSYINSRINKVSVKLNEGGYNHR